LDVGGQRRGQPLGYPKREGGLLSSERVAYNLAKGAYSYLKKNWPREKKTRPDRHERGKVKKPQTQRKTADRASKRKNTNRTWNPEKKEQCQSLAHKSHITGKNEAPRAKKGVRSSSVRKKCAVARKNSANKIKKPAAQKV